jgi:hypothetical protein
MATIIILLTMRAVALILLLGRSHRANLQEQIVPKLLGTRWVSDPTPR